jgi:hypothetical protein
MNSAISNSMDFSSFYRRTDWIDRQTDMTKLMRVNLKRFLTDAPKISGTKTETQPPIQLHSLYSSPGIIRMIKSRRMRWAGHVA